MDWWQNAHDAAVGAAVSCLGLQFATTGTARMQTWKRTEPERIRSFKKQKNKKNNPDYFGEQIFFQ